jgi:hypothetical protein
MNRAHPNARFAILLATASLVVGGCRGGQSLGMTNPFLAPERVPPPATRALAPGTAQPYYSGDALPSMQSGASTTDAPRLAARTESASRGALALTNEPSVAIPGDSEALRFPPIKRPEPEPIAAAVPPASHAAPAPSVANNNVPTIAPMTHPPVTRSSDGVTPAAYAHPLASSPSGSGLWRSPQIHRAVAAAPGQLPYPASPVLAAAPAVGNTGLAVPNFGSAAPTYVQEPAVAAPTVATQPSMGVTLRAVPSPIPEPIESPPPRIRLPGHPAAQAGAATGVGPAANYAIPGSVHTVQVTPLPAMGASPPSTAVAALGSVSSDGFRPRGSMR